MIIRTLEEGRAELKRLGISSNNYKTTWQMRKAIEAASYSKPTVSAGKSQAKPNFPKQDEPNSHEPKPLDPKNPKSPMAGQDLKSMSTPELVDHYGAEVSRLEADFKAAQTTDPMKAAEIHGKLRKAQKNHAYASASLTPAEKSARKLHSLLED